MIGMMNPLGIRQGGLLGGGSGGLLGGVSSAGGQPNTQQMMDQYLQSLFMRRYNPPAMGQQPGMIGSQMGPGGMQYMAPQPQSATAPQQTEMEKLREQLARLQQGANAIDPRVQRNEYFISGGPGGS